LLFLQAFSASGTLKMTAPGSTRIAARTVGL
jgi:hypothetical protein